MRFNILQQDLLPIIQSASRAIGVRNPLPVLSNILIEVADKKLKVAATNLEIAIIKQSNCQVVEEGEMTVPARSFLEIVSQLPAVNIEVSSSQEKINIEAANFSASLNGINANEFPAIPLSSDQSINLDANILQSACSQVSFAAAVDEGRPVLTGILTELTPQNFQLVATDGFRLAYKVVKLPKTQDKKLKTLIPRRTLEEVVRIISEEKDSQKNNIVIATSENQNQIIFTLGNSQISSRLIEGNFPAWEKIVPQKFDNRTVVDRLELIKAIKLAGVFTRSESNVVHLKVEQGKIILSSEIKELGSQTNIVDASTEGEVVNIAFNNKFLLEALQATDKQQVSIEFSGNISPALIRPVGEEGLQYVVMPIRTG